MKFYNLEKLKNIYQEINSLRQAHSAKSDKDSYIYSHEILVHSINYKETLDLVDKFNLNIKVIKFSTNTLDYKNIFIDVLT